MAKLIFKLQSVSDEEAQDIKSLLTEHHMDFYESPPGNWGISVHALWLHDESQQSQAKKLIEEYQQERSRRIKLETQQKIASGEYETFFKGLLNRPIQFILTLSFVLLILYLSIMPYLDIAG